MPAHIFTRTFAAAAITGICAGAALGEEMSGFRFETVDILNSVSFGFSTTDQRRVLALQAVAFRPGSQRKKKTYDRLDSPDRAARLKHLIGFAEAGKDGYDAVQHGARVRPDQPPTHMTLAEIFAWIKATPQQPHAIGRYQFIPKTLKQLVRRSGMSVDTVFSPRTQDRLADLLLVDAGYNKYVSGHSSRAMFMHNLAGIWAGLPASTGLSRYEGYAGNSATITWEFFDREVAAIFEK